MNIGFDAKRLFNNFTGLGNYSRFVVQALIQHAPDNGYVLYTPAVRKHPEIDPIVFAKKVTVVQPSATYTFFKASGLWRTWGIAKEDSIKSLQVYHGLSQELPVGLPATIRKIVTVHDLIFLRFPKLYSSIDVRIYKTKVIKACQSADVVVAISQQTAQDLMDFLNVPESKIKVVYQGCHPQFLKNVSGEEILGVKAKYRLPKRYLLNVGTIETRKNIMLAVKALALLPPAGRLPLVVLGKETSYKAEVVTKAIELGVSDAVIFLHGAVFSDFPAIYQGADLFIYPSLFEGFGIPLVEALESGVPVITSMGSCFQEAAGPDAVYVDPTNEEELAFQINRVLTDYDLRHQMIASGKRFTKKFSSLSIAQDLLEIYK